MNEKPMLTAEQVHAGLTAAKVSQEILDAVSIVGHLSKSMREDESLVGWVKRMLGCERELAEVKAYADKLAEGLPCLPKDIEVLHTANARLAEELAAVKVERDRLREAAKDALEIAENCIAYDDPCYDIEETLKEVLAGE